MKSRIILFLLNCSIIGDIFCSSMSVTSPYALLQHPKGWHMYNNTLTALSIARVVESTEKITSIGSQDNEFIAMSDQEYPITIKRDHPSPLHVPNQGNELPKIHRSEDIDCEYLVIQENEDGKNGKETFDVIRSALSFLLVNRTDTDEVYYAWYKGQRRVTLPREVGAVGHCAPVYPPRGEKLSLVINFDKEHLGTQSFGKSSLELGNEKLDASENKEIILIGGKNKSLDTYDTKSNITVINTTNIPLYCALFLYQNSQAKERYGSVCHILQPQRRTLIPRMLLKDSSKKKDGDSRLVASIAQASVNELQEEKSSKHFAIFPLSANKARCLLITTDLKNNDCPFTFTQFGSRSSNILPYIFTTFTPSQRLFSAGVLAQVEKKIPTLEIKNVNSNDDDNGASEEVLEGIIGEFPLEKTFLEKRNGRIWDGIIKLLGGRGKVREILSECGIDRAKDQVADFLKTFPAPRIGIAFTGGGFRAMVETLGFLLGAEKEDILDCCSYMCGLSGSTWAISGLVASGKSVDAFAEDLRKKVNIEVVQPDIVQKTGGASLRQLLCNVASDASYIRRTLMQGRFNQPQGLVGFYGHALAHALLDGITVNNKAKHDITFSDLQTNLSDARYPLPICVAVESKQNTSERKWLEFSPWYVATYKIGIARPGHNDNGICIETKNFGSLYKDNKIVQRSPEYPLAQLMGIWGSAFALSISDIQERLSPASSAMVGAVESFDTNFGYCYRTLFPQKNAAPAPSRFAAGEVPSFLYVSEENASGSHQMREEDKQFLIDGGISLVQGNTHNFASIPPLVRGVKILILCDCTSKPNEEMPQHLIATQKEAANLGLPFPKISEANKEDLKNEYKLSTVITENNKPTVIYMRGKKSLNTELNSTFDPDPEVAKFTKTSNFSYKLEEYNALKDHAKKIMCLKDTRQAIKEAVKTAIKAQFEKKKVELDANKALKK